MKNSENQTNENEQMDTKLPALYWFIDLGWYDQNNRSLLSLALGSLCPKCRKRLKVGKGEVPMPKIISAIRDCCSTGEDFVTPKLPLVECAFRLILANGNEPIDSEELVKKLGERRGTSNHSAQTINRLLAKDRYYGITQSPVTDS